MLDKIAFLSLFVSLITPLARAAAPATTTAPRSIGIVCPDGAPAAGALAAVSGPGHSIQVIDGKAFDDDPSYARGVADSSGRVDLSLAADSALLVVIHPSGLAVLRARALGSSINLEPWAAVSGTRRLNGAPAAAHPLDAWTSRDEPVPYDPNIPYVMFLDHATTDLAGKFVVSHLCGGEADIASAEVFESFGHSSLDRPLRVVPTTAGQTATIDFGGAGAR